MLRQRLIASLLLQNGRLVKGEAYANHRDAGLPHTTARAHNAQGIDEIILLDIDAARSRRAPDYDALEKVAANCRAPLTFGGGIDNVETARQCMRHGADKVMLTSTALDQPSLITKLSRVFGTQAIVLGIDLAEESGQVRLYDHIEGRTSTLRSPLEWAEVGVRLGAGEIRVMRVDREGKRNGLDLSIVGAMQERLSVPILIEGGAGDLEHVDAAFATGANGVCLGTMLVFSDNNIVKIKRFLADRQRNIRALS